MARKHWLVKSEPYEYSWDDLVAEGACTWEGVRNYTARLNLMAMRKGDLLLYYHSVRGKDVVGIARVRREHFPDPTDAEGRWVAVEIEPVRPFERPVTLAEIKSTASLAGMELLRLTRLSVVPVRKAEFDRILKLGKTKL